MSLISYHSDCIRCQQLLGGHCSDISDIGKDIHKCDQWDGDEDGSGKVPVEGEEVRGGRPGTWDHLPHHEVQGVPSVLLHEADLAAFCDVSSS